MQTPTLQVAALVVLTILQSGASPLSGYDFENSQGAGCTEAGVWRVVDRTAKESMRRTATCTMLVLVLRGMARCGPRSAMAMMSLFV